MNDTIRKFRDKAFKENIHCKYCGIEMILPNGKPIKGESHPSNMCTINHKISRHNPLRGILQNLEICCSKCNEDLAIKDMEAFVKFPGLLTSSKQNFGKSLTFFGIKIFIFAYRIDTKGTNISKPKLTKYKLWRLKLKKLRD
jgi:hypothetical protein